MAKRENKIVEGTIEINATTGDIKLPKKAVKDIKKVNLKLEKFKCLYNYDTDSLKIFITNEGITKSNLNGNINVAKINTKTKNVHIPKYELLNMFYNLKKKKNRKVNFISRVGEDIVECKYNYTNYVLTLIFDDSNTTELSDKKDTNINKINEFVFVSDKEEINKDNSIEETSKENVIDFDLPHQKIRFIPYAKSRFNSIKTDCKFMYNDKIYFCRKINRNTAAYSISDLTAFYKDAGADYLNTDVELVDFKIIEKDDDYVDNVVDTKYNIIKTYKVVPVRQIMYGNLRTEKSFIHHGNLYIRKPAGKGYTSIDVLYDTSFTAFNGGYKAKSEKVFVVEIQ